MAAMRDQLKALFLDEERNAAAAIGESGDLAPDEKVLQLFQALDDPLLSADDVSQLLGNTTTLKDIEIALKRLDDAGTLESSIDTQRPLDDSGIVLYRLTNVPVERLKLVALEAQLPDGSTRYVFGCEGRIIRSIARVQRLDALTSEGQQRDEILAHVKKIAKGIADGVQVPNSLLLSFLSDHTFTPTEDDEGSDVPASFVVIRPLMDSAFEVRDPQSDKAPLVQSQRLVELDLPFRRAAFDSEKSALLVDGQQRTAALSLVSIDLVPRFEFSVNAVVKNADEAKEVFAVANSARPIPTDFRLALLGAMDDESGFLKDERFTAQVTRRLAVVDGDSPFYGIAKYPGLRGEKSQVVAYNTLFNIVREFQDSALKYDDDAEVLTEYIKRAFAAVADTWPEAWGLKPSNQARLMGGLGLRSTAGMVKWQLEKSDLTQHVSEDEWTKLKGFLDALRTRVLWTEDEANAATDRARKFWRDHIKDGQNTSQDISRLFTEMKKLVPSLAVPTA